MKIVHNKNHTLQIEIPAPKPTYLDKIMRKDAFLPLWDLFKRAHAPAKEITESYSALVHLKPYIHYPKYRVIHVGDGAHARTAAMFAFLTKTHNISIDPINDLEVTADWISKYKVERFKVLKARVEEFIETFNSIKMSNGQEIPTLLTFVHAHVNTDEILSQIENWDAAFVMPCCKKQHQFSTKFKEIKHDVDWNVLSPERDFQVVTRNLL